MDENLQTVYHDFELPIVAPGKYQLKVVLGDSGIQKLRENKLDDTNEQTFYVYGTRFNLPSSSFNSCYPPEQAAGDFSECLPHLVFNKSTLPWQWDVLKDQAKDGLKAPWLALLLFHELEIPKTEPIKIENLNNLKSVEGEDFKADCLSIEIDIQLYNQIVPTVDELPFLFHTKTKGDEKYAVGLCNRMPKIGRNEVHLISLMGMDKLSNLGKVRLVSLKKWSFQSFEDHKGNFTDLVCKLQNGPIRNKANFGNNSLSLQLKQVLSQRGEQAFSLLPHLTVDGKTSSSWYRGPLIPFLKERKEECYIHKYTSLNREVVDPDLSYTAAWQLGQLIAFKDQIYIQKLQAWRQIILAKSNSKTSTNQLDTLVNQLDKSSLINFKKENKNTNNPNIDKLEKLDLNRQLLLNWLTDLSLLHNVPYYYLLASDQIVHPKGEISFFYLDPEWIEHLLSGALSFVFLGSSQVSSSLLYELRKLMSEIKHSTFSGFLLRSNVVKDWPNMEIEFSFSNQSIPLVRRENLSDTILLAIYEGPFDQVSLSEPFQSLHFGFENDGTRLVNNKKITKKVKNTQDTQDTILDINEMKGQLANCLDVSVDKISPASFAYNMMDSADRVTFKQ